MEPRSEEAKIRVLLVDDVPDIRLMTRLALELDPRFVVAGEAGDGAKAVEMAGELRPDLVLLDLAMPGMGGLEAIAKIHRMAPGCRVVAYTGFHDDVGREAMSLCAYAYLQKGIPTKELVESLVVAHQGPPKTHPLTLEAP